VDPQLLKNVLAFYADLDQPFATKQDTKQWQKTLAARINYAEPRRPRKDVE